MATKILICLVVVITPTLCDIDSYVYTEYCKPPFPGPNEVTTLSPGPSSTVYPALLPIERCCPQCEKCKHLGGNCILKWALDLYEYCNICDFEPVQPCRDYSCKCCIVCQDDKCSDCTESGGHCRKHCRANEQEDTWNNCSYSECKCCKKCEATNECIEANGVCRTNPSHCPYGTYPSTGCCGSCTCCKPVFVPIPDSRCADTEGAYCTPDGGDDCLGDSYPCLECEKTLFNYGLSSTVLGYCCIPKNAPVPSGPGRIDGMIHHKIGKKIHHNIGNKINHNIENLEAEQAHKIHAQNRHPRQIMD